MKQSIIGGVIDAASRFVVNPTYVEIFMRISNLINAVLARLGRQRWQALAAGVGLLLLLALLLIRIYGPQPEPLDPFVRYRPAMKPAFQAQFDDLSQAPRYDITVELNAQENVLTGRASIAIVNTSPDPWPNLIFRLYPGLEHYGGRITLQSVGIGDQPVPYDYQAENSAMRVHLQRPLQPQEQVEVRLVWQLDIPVWTDSSSTYALFGNSQQMTSLPLFYPALAVYQPGPTASSGRWWLDQGTVRGDAAFNVTSLFVVTATLPAELVPVTSGTLITSTLLNPNQARHVWVTGPSREFLLHASPTFSSVYTEALGTRVTSYWLPGQEAAGRAALGYAVAALRIYSDRFGPYPYRDLRVAPAPLSYRGMEYPQVSLLGVELYSLFRNDLEMLVAHEVAHQWWYQIVHNDPVNEPWLDEALAEYSMKLYIEKLYGQKNADDLQTMRWQLPLDALKAAQTDGAIDQPVANFANGAQYEAIIYGKGALLYAALRQTLGDRAFDKFLQDYLSRHRYQIVDSKTWLTDIQTLKNPNLNRLYRDWVQKPLFSAPMQVDTDETPEAP